MHFSKPLSATAIAILMWSQAASANDTVAKPLTITGQINTCYKLKHPLVRLRAVLPFTNKHMSAIVPVKPDGHFIIQATTAELPNGRYEVQIGDDADDLDGTDSHVDIRGAGVDAGVVGDCDSE